MDVISINICGGLGNNMFQIATGYSKSVDENAEFIVDVTELYGSHYPIQKYKNNIFRKIKFSNEKIKSEVFVEQNFHYTELPTFQRDIKLSGYFQSEKYFKKNREKILELFEVNDDIKSKLNNRYSDILKNKTCSIHVRRGDYLHLTNHHPVLSLDYYKNSHTIIGDDFFYLIFSDDLNYCKDNFDFITNKKFVDDLEDFEELYLMSLCDNNIIANSSFSWWGAWLNTKENLVISPKKWFGSAYDSYNTNDLYCSDWTLI